MDWTRTRHVDVRERVAWPALSLSICCVGCPQDRVLSLIEISDYSKQIVWRGREREIHYVHWASKAYEDESVFMSEAHLGWQ